EGLRDRQPFVAAVSLDEEFGPAAVMAAMDSPGADLLAIAHVAEGHRGIGAAHRLRQRESTPEGAGATRAVDHLEFLHMPGESKLEYLDGDVRAVAVDTANGVIAVREAAPAPTD